MKNYITFVFFLLSSIILLPTASAQKAKKIIKKGDAAFEEKDYYSAAQYYNQAILKDSSELELQYKYAEASRLNYDYEIAEWWYKKVYKKDGQGKLFPECVFWLASIKKSKGDYKEAIALFNKYAKKNKKNKKSYYYKKAEQEIASCKYAQWLVLNPDTTITIIHLDTAVNSTVSEYAPIQVDSILYFSSLRNTDKNNTDKHAGYSKMYASNQLESSWGKALELDTLYNTFGVHNANTSFNADFSVTYFSKCEQLNSREFSCKIYSSEYKNGEWTRPVILPSEINMSGTNNTQPAIGFLGEEEVLFFSSNRSGGEGGLDIWYCKLNSDGTFGKAINAGKKVNSIEDEKTPFYCKPCQELFFSSTWHKGLGGFDIFRSNYDTTGFGEPQNLGLPINSAYNDVYFSINSEKTKAFLSSNRIGSYFEDKETCCNDIYTFDIPGSEKEEEVTPEDSIAVAISNMNLLFPINLYFHNDEPDRRTLATSTKQNYKSTFEKYYGLKNLYEDQFSKGAKPTEKGKSKEAIDELFEDSISAGMRKLEEFAALVKQVMQNGQSVTIILKGFSSPLASAEYNNNLSKRRISSIVNYFKEYENGILLPYIDNKNKGEGSIIFVEQEYGETNANKKVSDDTQDVKNSIYSPAAALERKIEIIAVYVNSTK